MSILYYAAGSQWYCSGCDQTVRVVRYLDERKSTGLDNGAPYCRCGRDELWKAVCRKCLNLYRSRRGLKRLKLPFSREIVWRLSLFGWTLEWAYGAIDTDVFMISSSIAP